jgi:hypothetical protein
LERLIALAEGVRKPTEGDASYTLRVAHRKTHQLNLKGLQNQIDALNVTPGEPNQQQFSSTGKLLAKRNHKEMNYSE